MVTQTPDITAGTGLEHRIELSPNCSLTPATARVFVGSLAALTFATAGYFTWLGFWPIFVVAVLEIGLLLNLREGVTELSREIYSLHMLILWVCVVIAVAVFGVMIYSIATFRKSKGAVAADFDHNTKAESSGPSSR
jgi:hypothetical protein